MKVNDQNQSELRQINIYIDITVYSKLNILH